MAGSIYFPPNQALDSNGDPASGAKAYFYDTGTTNLQTVYADSGLSTAHPSPLVADSTGHFAAVYSAGSTDLKVNVTDSADAQLDGYPIDPAVFQSAGAGASTIAFSPTARISATDVQAAIEEVHGDVEAIEDARTIEKSVYTTAGTTTAYTIAVTGITAYATGDRYWVRANATNTAACTINVESAGAKDIKKYDSAGSIAALAANDFVIGSEYLLHYDGTQFVIISERYARAADSVWETGTSTIQYGITPANAKAAAAAHADLTSPYESSGQTITSGGTLTLAHGLGAIPRLHEFWLVCITNDGAYTAGEQIGPITPTAYIGGADTGFMNEPDATNLKIVFGGDAVPFKVLSPTGARQDLVEANWEFYVRAWA